MRAHGQAKANVPSILPLALLLVPKCPLCVLPLFAAAGLALPTQGILNGLAAAAAAAWVALLASASRSTSVRALAISAAVLFLCGRWTGLPAIGWAGVLLMVGVAIGVRAREHGACPASGRIVPAGEPAAPRP